MWLSNDNSHVCGESFVADGACCCNCKHLKKYVVDGVVVGHYYTGIEGNVVPKQSHHSLCEMHQFVNRGQPPTVETEGVNSYQKGN